MISKDGSMNRVSRSTLAMFEKVKGKNQVRATNQIVWVNGLRYVVHDFPGLTRSMDIVQNGGGLNAPEPRARPEPEPKPKPEPRARPKPEPEPEFESELKTESKFETEPEPEFLTHNEPDLFTSSSKLQEQRPQIQSVGFQVVDFFGNANVINIFSPKGMYRRRVQITIQYIKGITTTFKRLA